MGVLSEHSVLTIITITFGTLVFTNSMNLTFTLQHCCIFLITVISGDVTVTKIKTMFFV